MRGVGDHDNVAEVVVHIHQDFAETYSPFLRLACLHVVLLYLVHHAVLIFSSLSAVAQLVFHMPDVVAWAGFHIQGEDDDVGYGVWHAEGRGLKRQRAGVVDEDVTRMSVAGGVLVQGNRYILQGHDSFEPCAIPPEPRRSGRPPRLLVK